MGPTRQHGSHRGVSDPLSLDGKIGGAAFCQELISNLKFRFQAFQEFFQSEVSAI